MTDTELLISCGFCGSVDVQEHKGMVATTFQVDKPGDLPREIRLKVYACGQCGRMFNEMEGRGEGE